MLIFSIVAVVCLSSTFAPSLGRPLSHESDSPSDEGDYPQEDLDLPANGELFEGDIVMDNNIRRAVWGQQSKKSAIRHLEGMNLKWPGGVQVYEIGDDFSPHHRKMLKDAMHEFETRTCIRFKKRTTEKNYVHYTMWKDMCASNVGMSGGRQNVTLGKDCGVLGTFEHEIMHTLGFIHEHSRPDRDNYLKIHFKNIKKNEWKNFQKYKWTLVTNLKETFNFASIMLYRNNAFTKNGNDTISALAEPKLKFGQRDGFSAGDVKEINNLYGCTHFQKNPNYHHLYEEYHTKSVGEPAKISKGDKLTMDMLDIIYGLKNKLKEKNYLK